MDDATTRTRVAELLAERRDELIERTRERLAQASPSPGVCTPECRRAEHAEERATALIEALTSGLVGTADETRTQALAELVRHDVGEACTLACLLSCAGVAERSARAAVQQALAEPELEPALEALSEAADRVRVYLSEAGAVPHAETEPGLQDQYRKLIENASDAIFVVDTTDGRIVLANPAASALTGYAHDDLIGLSVFELDPRREQEDWQNLFVQLRQLRQVSLLERDLRRRDGSTISVDISASSFEHEGRMFASAIVRDSSERQHLEENLARHAAELQSAVDAHVIELRRLKELNERIVESLPSRLILLDDQLTVVHANAAYCRQRGVSREEMEGKPLAEVFPESLMVEAGLEEAIRHTLDTGQTKRWAGYRHATAGHPERILNIRLDRVDAPGRRLLLVAIDDVTEDARRMYELSMLSQIARAMQGTLELDRLLFAILTCVTAGPAVGLGFNRAFLLLADEEKQELVCRLAVGPESAEHAAQIWGEISQQLRSLDDFVAEYDHIASLPEPPLHGIVSQLRFPLSRTDEVVVMSVQNRQPYHIRQASTDPRVSDELRALLGAEEFVVVPLVARDRVIGVVLADNLYSQQPIGPMDVQLLTRFADQAALALDNAWAYQRLADRATELQEAYRQLAEAQEQVLRTERLATVGEMAAHVAHEIRNPLATIGGFARSIARHPDKVDRVKRNVDIIVEETDRLEHILHNLLDFARPRQPEFAVHEVAGFLADLEPLVREDIDDKPVELQIAQTGECPPVEMDRAQMRQVLLNLTKNAIQAMPDGGQLSLTASSEDDYVELVVTDTGQGIAPEVLDDIFEPFFTTKPGGSGLGLAVTRQIVADHHGELRVTSELGSGSSFVVRLPVRQPASEPEVEPPKV